MYGSHREFEGRITGFTMGTGSTLALLPAQNATGNFINVVQRLPVRIDFSDYDPDKETLFIGLSVEPHVWFKEKPADVPNAGKLLRPLMSDLPLINPDLLPGSTSKSGLPPAGTKRDGIEPAGKGPAPVNRTGTLP
jgi:membrane fusion protein, multidrug efflux system